MKIYAYHPSTGVYVGESVADESPLEPGVHLIPANATTIAPPPYGADMEAIWTGKKWETRLIPKHEPEPELPKPTEQEIINMKARGYLYETDWYVIRRAETGEKIPEDVLTKRAEARASIVE